MNNDPISTKLQELFDLHKSGALSKEEYDLLKSQILNTGGSPQPEKSKVDVTSPKPTEPIVQPREPVEKPLIQPAKVKQTVISTEQPDISVKKSGSKTLIVSVIVILIIGAMAAFFLLKSNNGNKEVSSSNVPNESQERLTNTTPTTPVKTTPWDEAKAREIVLKELAAYKDWAKFFSENGANGENPEIQLVGKFVKVEMSTEEVYTTLAFTNIKDNDCQACSAVLSFFEFKFLGEWKLSRKDFGFKSCLAGLTEPTFSVEPISSNNFVLIHVETDGTQGYDSGRTSLYIPIGDSLKCVLNFCSSSSDIGANGKENYISNLRIVKEDNGYYPIELSQSGTDAEGKKIDNKIIYKFNGDKYLNSNSITPYQGGQL